VPRPQLLARLGDKTNPALVLVVAPAGYGKITLLTDWIMTDERVCAWLSLDEEG
jgi:LuxR family transcriptional regulator, maltose regulon positive regulatory protein